jgi:DNA repair protein RadA/Sms
MAGEWPACVAHHAMAHLLADANVGDIETLPSFFMHNILSPNGRYHGVRLVVLDSIQGNGLPSASLKKYAKLYEFTRLCQAAGITTLLIGHVTKNGAVQGPRDLEHNVDAVIQLCKAVRFRALSVPKNRFGPAMVPPLSLTLDDVTTNLEVSPHAAPITSVVRSYLPSPRSAPVEACHLTEVQCSVSLPAFGARGKVTAPGIPMSEVYHVLKTISQMPQMEIGDMDFTIHTHLPEERRFKNILGLPIAMSLLGSYLQRPIDSNHIYLGEIDLCRKVRDVPIPLIDPISRAYNRSEFFQERRTFCSLATAEYLKNRTGIQEIIGCERLEDVINLTWPQLG